MHTNIACELNSKLWCWSTGYLCNCSRDEPLPVLRHITAHKLWNRT